MEDSHGRRKSHHNSLSSQRVRRDLLNLLLSSSRNQLQSNKSQWIWMRELGLSLIKEQWKYLIFLVKLLHQSLETLNHTRNTRKRRRNINTKRKKMEGAQVPCQVVLVAVNMEAIQQVLFLTLCSRYYVYKCESCMKLMIIMIIINIYIQKK